MSEIKLSEIDKYETIKRYTERYLEFGYSPKSLGWNKGKQDIRFDVLTSQYDCRGKTILDIGCGFGDLNNSLRTRFQDDYSYIGIDLVPDLIKEAQSRYIDHRIKFIEGNFLEVELDEIPDFAIASGIFNHKLKDGNNYEVIEATMRKAFSLSRDGFAFDFLTDRVDFTLSHTFHSDPGKILSLALQLSRNVVLRNDYMPFEFSIFVFKDDAFLKEDTVFNRYKSIQLHG